MCFASAPASPRAATPDDYEFVDSSGTVVPESTKGAIRRLKLRQYESIMFSGNDAAGNQAPGSTSGEGNTASSSDATGGEAAGL